MQRGAMMLRSVIPGDLHAVASWIETVWYVSGDVALCCDVSTCGHFAGWCSPAEPTNPCIPDSIIGLWSAEGA